MVNRVYSDNDQVRNLMSYQRCLQRRIDQQTVTIETQGETIDELSHQCWKRNLFWFAVGMTFTLLCVWTWEARPNF